mmetsp:Transcript_32174/g.44623  ORF Transcript_32174/g.44623 Transcript_32174/m.44623 type:complete len:391 (-) Transcript_32174:47-1219(-)
MKAWRRVLLWGAQLVGSPESLLLVALLLSVGGVTIRGLLCSSSCDQPVPLLTGALALLLQLGELLVIGIGTCQLFLWAPKTAALHTMLLLGLWLVNLLHCVLLLSTWSASCPSLRILLLGGHASLGLVNFVLVVFLLVLLLLGPPSFNRHDKSGQGVPVQVNFLEDADLGAGPSAREIVAAGGTIGLCHCPGRFQALKEDLLVVKSLAEREGGQKVARSRPPACVLVTLMERRELELMGLPHFMASVRDLGLESEHFPIRDKWVPSDHLEFIKLVQRLVAKLKCGHQVVVHCYGGKGRTGTLTGALLLALWEEDSVSRRTLAGRWGLTAAVKTIRTRRPGSLKNLLQRIYLKTLTAKYDMLQFQVDTLKLSPKVSHNLSAENIHFSDIWD